MATQDYNLANQDGASFRSDLNNALSAIVSNNSSSTAPATTFAHQIWVDTTANVIKQRNAANDAWVELWRIDGGFNAKTFSSNVTLNAQSDLRFADSDSSNWVAFQAPATVASNVTWTLPSADGTADQALTTNGSGVLSWADAGGVQDNITEGNTSAEVVDTGSDGHFKVVTEGTEALRVNASQQVGIGTASPNGTLSVAESGNGARVTLQNTSSVRLNYIGLGADDDIIDIAADESNQGSNSAIALRVDGSERARIDSSGRLLVGTSSSVSVSGDNQLQVFGEGLASSVSLTRSGATTQSANLTFGRTRGDAATRTVLNSDDTVGRIHFAGDDGTDMLSLAATIQCNVDGTPGSNDMPGRLVFSTTADGASSPTEQMRLDSSGNLKFNSGYGSAATAYGCRAWVNFNGSGTVSIRGSGNVSSISDNGTGQFYTNFANGMPDTNYAGVCSHNAISGGNDGAQASPDQTYRAFVQTGAAGSWQDPSVVCVAIFR